MNFLTTGKKPLRCVFLMLEKNAFLINDKNAGIYLLILNKFKSHIKKRNMIFYKNMQYLLL